MSEDTKKIIDWIKGYISDFQYSIENIKGKEYIVCDELDLIHQEISELPNSIGNLKCEGIYLSNNNIKELPKSIGNLICEYLYLNYNQITKLPEEIGCLKCDELDFSDNKIKDEDIKWVHLIGLKECFTDYSYDLNMNNKLSKINSRKHIIKKLLLDNRENRFKF
jgi:hypothetical protein